MIRWFVSLVLTSLVLCASAAIAQQQPASITRFTRDPALLEAKEAQIVALMRQQSPDAAAGVEQLFSQDLIALIAPELERMGLDDQDMADMTTVYWVAAWEASNGVVGRQTDPALVRGARDQIAGVLGANPATQAMSDREKQDVADTMLLQAILVEARMGAAAGAGAAMQTQMSDTIHAEASGMLDTDLRQVTLTAAGFAPATGVSEPAGPAPQAAAESMPAIDASPAPHPENWAQMEGVYFRSYTTFGVGGMVIFDYEPLALFSDGTYYEVEGDALEDIDLAASRRSAPDQWGRWSRNGDGFTLTGADGRPAENTLQGGSFFKAFPAEASGGQLAAKYSRVSGGGDSALGGEMTIAAQTDLSFTADGGYMRASSAGAIGSGDATGVATAAYSRQSAGGAGRYRIEQHTITLTEPDGTTRRQFFAFGSRGTPPQPATNMIFLGDQVYVVMDD